MLNPVRDNKTNVKQALVKKLRKGGPHSKNGCATCRRRHIKCDESRPACFRCTSTGRKCDGYQNKIQSSSSEVVVTTPWTSSAICLLPQAGRDDFRYIQFFHLRSASALTGYYDSPFWSKLLIQASFTDAAVRHALVAVSSCFEAQEKSASAGQGLGAYLKTHSKDHHFVLRQYNNAIRSLTQRQPHSKPSKEVILITCLLFTCLEFLHGNVHSALMHISNGIHMLHEDRSTRSSTDLGALLPLQAPALSRSPSQSTSSSETGSDAITYSPMSLSRSVSPNPDPDEISKMVLPLFSRLSVMSSFFGQPVFEKISSDDDLRALCIPAAFASLSEAQDNLTVILTGVFAFYRESHPRRYAHASALPNYPPESDRRLRKSLLADWSSAFTAFLSTHQAHLSSVSLRTVSFLKMLRHILIVFLGVCFTPYELAYDAHLADFTEIVSLAANLIEDESIPSKLLFSFEMGVVPQLYWAALKCRHHSLRWRAVELLKRSQRREGLWDSVLDARVAARVIEIEEQGLQFKSEGEGGVVEEEWDSAKMSLLVPETKRVYNAAIERQPPAPLGTHPVHVSTRPGGSAAPFVVHDEFV